MVEVRESRQRRDGGREEGSEKEREGGWSVINEGGWAERRNKQ